jgi:hypothetical protein
MTVRIFALTLLIACFFDGCSDGDSAKKTSVSLPPLTAIREPSGFQGIPWGAGIDVLKKVYPAVRKARDRDGISEYVVRGVTIANIQDCNLSFSFVNGRFEHVFMSFQNAITSVAEMRGALEAESGKPSKSDPDGTLWWVGKRITISLREDGAAYSAYLTMSTQEYEKTIDEAWKNKSEVLRRDLFPK